MDVHGPCVGFFFFCLNFVLFWEKGVARAEDGWEGTRT